jgi:hypothetical protein
MAACRRASISRGTAPRQESVPGRCTPVALRQPGSILEFEYPPSERSIFAGSEWSGNKVHWFVAPSYRGPALIRGRQADGSHGVRFGQLPSPAKELRILPLARRLWPRDERAQASEVRVRAPGCYAWQVDGTSLSRIVVFKALEREEPGADLWQLEHRIRHAENQLGVLGRG